MRKLVTLLLALTMVLGMMSFASADDTYNLDIYWVGNGDNTAIRSGVEKAVNAYIEPLIGATVTYHIIGWDEWNDKAINALQSGEKMDLIFTADWEGYGVEVAGGLLTPLDDLLEEYGQGIKETLPKTFLDGVRVNGVLYGIPTNKELCVPEGYAVNVTAAKEIGWDVVMDDPTITCMADLEPWLAKYKELYPSKYPYLMDGAAGRWPFEPWVKDMAVSNDFISMKMAVQEDGTFDETLYSVFETDIQEAHIREMYDFAQKGYIDPDAALTSFDYNGTFGRGDFLVMALPLKGNNIKATEMYEANHTVDFEYTEITTQPKYVITVHAGGSMFGIPVTSKNPAKAMQYINLMHSDATLVNLMLFGEEGVNYVKAEDGRVEIVADANWYGVHGGAWTVGNTLLQYVTTAEDPNKNAMLQSYADDAIPTASLGFRFVKDDVADEIAAMENVISEYINPLMCGMVDPDDATHGIAAMQEAMHDAGIDTIMAELQSQYDAWKAAQE